MAGAAKFRALTVIKTRLLDSQEPFVEPAGDGVHLEPQRRHGKGVNHIGSGGLDPQRHAGGHHHALVHGELRRFAAGDRIFIRKHVRDHFDIAVIGVGVAPIPLVSGRLDRDRFFRRGFVLTREQRDRRNRDNHQDDDRDNRPDHFDHGVVCRFGRNRVRTAVEAHDHPQQQTKNQQADQGDDRKQDDIVHPQRIFAVVGVLILEGQAGTHVGLGRSRHALARFGLHRRVGADRFGRCGFPCACFLRRSRGGDFRACGFLRDRGLRAHHGKNGCQKGHKPKFETGVHVTHHECVQIAFDFIPCCPNFPLVSKPGRTAPMPTKLSASAVP